MENAICDLIIVYIFLQGFPGTPGEDGINGTMGPPGMNVRHYQIRESILSIYHDVVAGIRWSPWHAWGRWSTGKWVMGVGASEWVMGICGGAPVSGLWGYVVGYQ